MLGWALATFVKGIKIRLRKNWLSPSIEIADGLMNLWLITMDMGLCCVWRVPLLAPAQPNYIQPHPISHNMYRHLTTNTQQHHYTITIPYHTTGADPGFSKGGGGGTTLGGFSGPPPASKVAQVPKKLMSGGRGGTPTLFFGAPPKSIVAHVPNGGGGEYPKHFCVPTHLCFFFFFFKGFKRGAHVQKAGGQL